MKPFPLINVALYAKNWYKRDNIWKDLAICLEHDEYGPFEDPYRERQSIVHLIAYKLRPYIKEYMWDQLLDSISPENCWKVGYYTTDHKWANYSGPLPTYEYWEAVVRTHLSFLVTLSKKELGWTDDMDIKPTIVELQKEEKQSQSHTELY